MFTVLYSIRVTIGLVRSELFETGKGVPAFFALPLPGPRIPERAKRVAANVIRSCLMIICHRVVINSIFYDTHFVLKSLSYGIKVKWWVTTEGGSGTR
jgi:hypothetical protein